MRELDVPRDRDPRVRVRAAGGPAATGLGLALAALAVLVAGTGCAAGRGLDAGSSALQTPTSSTPGNTDSGATAPGPQATEPAPPGSARAELAALVVKGRAPMTRYDRDAFGPAWADTDHNGCDTRNDVLHRDLTHLTLRPGTHGCIVLSGNRADPYTGRTIHFQRGGASELDIDHVVALGDAWQTGARQWPAGKRLALANDPLNLLAVGSHANRRKGDADAASWLPPNTAFRCDYVARQIAVKTKYQLWVTAAERAAMARILTTCPNEPAPAGGNPTIAAHR